MENAIPIYGMQHLCDNINHDVHMQLTYWTTFFGQLKNIYGLLSQGGRRQRFQWTCMLNMGQASSRYERKVRLRPSSLY